MKYALPALLSLATLAGHVGHAAEQTWIGEVTIVSPEKLEQVAVGGVLIENDRIVRVERGAGIAAPAGAKVVSGKGQFLVPGLIDSHVHLLSVPGVGFESDALKPDVFRAYFRQLPRSFLYFGYTTLIDLSVVDPKVLADFRATPLHPDLFDCGPTLPIANGYPMSFAPPETRFKLFPNFVYDPKQAASIPSIYKPEEHSPTAAVARAKAGGAICIKTYFERGFGRERNLPVIGKEAIAEVRTATKASALTLMMHANSFEAQRFAVDSGVDVIAHGLWNWGNLKSDAQLPAEILKLLDEIADKKIGYQPTMQVMGGLAAYFDAAYLKLPAMAKVMPKDMLAWYSTPAGQWFKKEVNDDDTPDAIVQIGFEKGPLARVRQATGYLAAKNANLLFGTDTPSSPTYGNVPGLNGYLEMQQLQKAGVSLPQIFRAATLNNARAFRLDAQVGTIEAGKIANLLLLKKSPLESLDAYDSIVTVWLHGKAVSRESLAIVN